MQHHEDDEVMRRMHSAKSLIQRGTHSSNTVESENILNEACDLLECWVKEFEEDEDETGNQMKMLSAPVDFVCVVELEVMLRCDGRTSPA
jgi:hypothetical protein